MKNLYKELNCLFFRNVFLFFDIGSKVSFIAELKNEVNIVDSLFDINEAYDVIILTGFKDLNFVIKELCELT